jgi:hypothetical protein
MTGTWHADDGQLSRYVAGDGDAMNGASIEQHLMHCADCRHRIAAHVAPEPLELTWNRIRQAAEVPRPTPVQRVLLRLGVPASDALLVAAAPSLRMSWLLGLAGSLSFVGLSVAYAGPRGLMFFLLVAPLVPVVGVAAAYGPAVDPAYEVGVAAPYPGERLLLLRTAAVLATCLPLVAATSLFVPVLNASAFAWLLPALAFSVVLLAASTWCRPVVAATGLGLAWVCTVGAAGLVGRPDAVLTPALLLGYTALGTAAAVVLRLRLHHLTEPGSSA